MKKFSSVSALVLAAILQQSPAMASQPSAAVSVKSVKLPMFLTATRDISIPTGISTHNYSKITAEGEISIAHSYSTLQDIFLQKGGEVNSSKQLNKTEAFCKLEPRHTNYRVAMILQDGATSFDPQNDALSAEQVAKMSSENSDALKNVYNVEANEEAVVIKKGEVITITSRYIENPKNSAQGDLLVQFGPKAGSAIRNINCYNRVGSFKAPTVKELEKMLGGAFTVSK